MKGKILALAILIVAALSIVGTAGASRVTPTPKSYNLTYNGACIRITTDNPWQQALLNSNTAVEVIYAPIFNSLGVQLYPGWYAVDSDQDPSGIDPDDALVGCAKAPYTQTDNAWVSSGSAPFGQNQARTVADAQALLDGTYVGIDGVYRTPFAKANGDGSYTLVPNTGAIPAGFKASGWAVGGDFFTTGASADLVAASQVADPAATWAGGLMAGWNIVIVPSS